MNNLAISSLDPIGRAFPSAPHADGHLRANRQSCMHFLSLSQQLGRDVLGNDVDSTSVRLLEVIALAAHQNRTLTVTQAMSLLWIASPATLHRKIKNLVAEGYVTHTHQGLNRRTRYLVLTEKSESFFNRLGESLVNCMAAAI